MRGRIAKGDRSEGAFEKQGFSNHHGQGENGQESQIPGNGHESRIFEQQRFESMYGIGEGINPGNGAHPGRKSVDGIDVATGKVQQSVEHAEGGAWHQGVIDADHQEEHHADQSQGSQDDDQQQFHQPEGLQRIGYSGDDGSHDGQDDPSQHRLGRSREVEAHDQLKFGNRRNQITFMKAARFIINIDNTSSDHRGNEDRHDDMPYCIVKDIWRYTRIVIGALISRTYLVRQY